MKKPIASKTEVPDPIDAYSQAQRPEFRAICEELRKLISKALPKSSSKVWHGQPVWFIGENPVVGFKATAKSVVLLFWNGRAFDEPDLKPLGQFQVAKAEFGDVTEIDAKAVRRWLKKAGTSLFDSVAFFKKRRTGE